MTPEEWVEEFTGLKADGQASARDAGKAADEADKEAALKLVALTETRGALAVVKADFQKAMQAEVQLKDAFFKDKKKELLKVDGTQTDEADFTEIDFSAIELSPQTQAVVDRGVQVISREGLRLSGLTVQRAGKPAPLFNKKELEEEYWMPLVRERILPETFVGDYFSKTQHMLDETNKLYQAAVAEKKKQGKLTPMRNKTREAVDVLADLATIGADMAGKFGGNAAQAKRAGDILNLIGEGVRTGGKVYDKAKEKEFADASSLALDNIALLCEIILTQKGAPKETIAAVKGGFKAGNAAIVAGKAFAQRDAEGVTKGVDSIGDVLKAALDAAAAATADAESKKRIQLAAATAPTALKAFAIGGQIALKVEQGDAEGVVDCLSKAGKATLNTIQDIRKIETMSRQSEKDGKETAKKLDKETLDITQDINLAAFGGKTLIAAATLARKGDHIKAINKIIQNVGNGLEDVLVKSGVDKAQAKQIAGIYVAASSAPAIFEALTNDPPDEAAALNALGSGIETSFKTAAPNSVELLRAGTGLKQGIAALAAGIKVKQHYDKGEYDKGIETFTTAVQTQVQGVFDIKDMKTAKQIESEAEAAAAKPTAEPAPETMRNKAGNLSMQATADERTRQKENTDKAKVKTEMDHGAKAPGPSTAPPDPNAALNEKIKNAVADIGKLAGKAQKDIAAGLAAAKAAADAKEAEEILAEAQAEARALSKAEQDGIDSSKIDALIAKIERDRVLWEMATAIVEGGTAFAATFVPALGAVGMGVRLAANMVAAGQRLQQYLKWADSQRDFEAAQSELTSASRNFVKNQHNQFIHYTIQAVFKAAQMIGNVLKVAAVAAAAGAALEASAAAAGKIEAIVYDKKKKYDVEKAWDVTKAALSNPSNRRLGLEARALNPTLAKYGIAWGAVIKKDPLARNALAACHLNEATLSNDDANVDKVVDYLERFYADDDKLYREVEEGAAWMPTNIELTLLSWTQVKQAAIKKAKLENADTGNIDGWLVVLKPKLATLGEKELAERESALQALGTALATYVPKTEKPKDAEAIVKVCKLLQKQAADEFKLVTARRRLVRDVVGAIDASLGEVEACQHTDGLDHLRQVLADARAAVAAAQQDDVLLKGNRVVASHIEQLEAKLKPLQRLIENMEKEKEEA